MEDLEELPAKWRAWADQADDALFADGLRTAANALEAVLLNTLLERQ